MDTRARILEKASEMFLSMGIRSVTMDAIASELGISKRTIYELFHDKDDLVVQALRQMIISHNNEMLGIITGSDNVIEAIVLIMRMESQKRMHFTKVFAEDIKKYYPVVYTSFYSCKESLKEFSASYRLLEKGIKEGIFRKGLRINLVDNFLHEVINLMHNSERIRMMNPQGAEVLDNIFLPYFRGLCTRKGLELMDKYFEN